MNDEKKDAMIASIENVQAIEGFLRDWYSVTELFETAANSASVLLEIARSSYAISDDDLKWLQKLIDQHVMMANLMKKFEKGGAA